MALKDPKKNAEKNAEKFIKGVDNAVMSPINDLKKLTLEELSDRAESVVKQSTVMIAMILKEGRRRLKTKEYADWIKDTPCLSVFTPQYRSALLRFANFAETHDMTGISVTAGIRMATVREREVAEEVYKHSHRKNLPVDEVMRLIEQKKAVVTIDEPEVEQDEPFEHKEKVVIEVKDNVAQTGQEEVKEDSIDQYVNAVIGYVKSFGISPFIAMKVLDECKAKLSKEIYKK